MIAIAAFAVSTARPAWAQSDAETKDLQDAQTLYSQGMDMRAAGNLQGAVDALRKAHALHATPITGLELGRTLIAQGKLLEARDILLSVALLPPRPNESERSNTARAEVASLAQALGDRIPSLRFRVDAVGPPPAVKVDGVAVDALDVPKRVDPGDHVVDVQSGTAHEARHVIVREGESPVVDLTSHREAPGPAPAPQEASSHRTIFWIGLGATAVAAAVGTVGGVIAIGDANTARPGCPGGSCDPRVHGPADTAETWATVSTVSFVVAAALGTATIVSWFLTKPSHPDRASLAPFVISF
jgi:hypothetical protein